jgi:uncharacterized membrane protein
VSLFELFKIIHIVAAMGWVGGAILSQVHSAFVQKRANPQDLMTFVEFQAQLGQRYFAPLAGIVVAAGIGMVIESPFDFTDTWVIIGIALWLVSALSGTFYLGPQTEKIKAGLAGGPPDTAMEQRIKNVVLVTRIDVVILVGVVVDMVLKPGT